MKQIKGKSELKQVTVKIFRNELEKYQELAELEQRTLSNEIRILLDRGYQSLKKGSQNV